MAKYSRKAPKFENLHVSEAPDCGVCDDESKKVAAVFYGRTARGLEPLCGRHFDRCLVPSKAMRYVAQNVRA